MIDTASSSERPRLEPRVGWLCFRDDESMDMRQLSTGVCCGRACSANTTHPDIDSVTFLKSGDCLLAWRFPQAPII